MADCSKWSLQLRTQQWNALTSSRRSTFGGLVGLLPIWNMNVALDCVIFIIEAFKVTNKSRIFSILKIIHFLKTYFWQHLLINLQILQKHDPRRSFAKNDLKWQLKFPKNELERLIANFGRKNPKRHLYAKDDPEVKFTKKVQSEASLQQILQKKNDTERQLTTFP